MDKNELSDMNDLISSIRESFRVLWIDWKPTFVRFKKWLKSNWHKFVHIIWMTIFVMMASSTGVEVWFWIAFFPAIAYCIFWMFVKKWQN